MERPVLIMLLSMFCTILSCKDSKQSISGSNSNEEQGANNESSQDLMVEGNFSKESAEDQIKKGWEKVPEILKRIVPPTFPEVSYNVLEHGAKGNASFDNSVVFQSLIDEVSTKGGGMVLVPSGQYFIDGPIHFRDNINLHLEEGARIYFSSNANSYLPAVKIRFEGTVCYNYSPLIYGIGLKNIAITGKGTVDGAARKWSKEWRKVQKPDKDRLRQMGNDKIPEEQRVFANGWLDLDGDGKDDGYGDRKEHFLRPSLIEFYECENILIDGVSVRESPFWTIHPVFCRNVTMTNLNVFGDTLNDDGIDPDSSEDVLIENCEIRTEDDAISIKAGRDQDAWDRPDSKNIVIRNNRLLSGVNALCIGSEMSGGVSQVFAENNYIANGKHALNFKCNLDRGGQVQHVYLRNTEISSCEEAMFIFRMDYHGYRGNNFPTKFNDFYVSGIKCGTVEKTPFKIVGVASEPISRVYISDVDIAKAGESSELDHVTDIIFDDVNIDGSVFALE